MFPFSVRLRRQNNTVVSRLSPAGSLMLEKLNRYCQIKTMCEGIEGWQVHQCLERRPTQCALARRGPLHALKSRTSKALLMYQFQRIGSLFLNSRRHSTPCVENCMFYLSVYIAVITVQSEYDKSKYHIRVNNNNNKL